MYRTLHLAALATFTFSLPSTLVGQEVGLLATSARSPNPELPAPAGPGAFAQLTIRGGWLLRLTWTRLSDATHKEGGVCEVYAPRIGCVIEPVTTSIRLSGLRLRAMRALSLGRHVRAAAGAGLSFNSLSATSTGSSGRRADLQLPNAGQIGYLAGAVLEVRPVLSLPLRVFASYGAHWVNFHACADPADPTSGYAPFCGADRFDELQAGLGIAVPFGGSPDRADIRDSAGGR